MSMTMERTGSCRRVGVVCGGALLFSILAVPGYAADSDSAAPPQPGAAEHNRVYQIARGAKELYDAGQFQAACAKFEEALAIDSVDPFSRLYLSMSLFRLGKTNEAIDCLDKSKTPEPDDVVGWYNAGVTYGMFGSFDKALKNLNYFVEHFTGDSRLQEARSLIDAFTKAKTTQLTDVSGDQDYFNLAVKEGATRWADNSMPVRVYLGSGKKLPGFDPAFVESVKSACNDWSVASGGIVSFEFVSSAKNAQIRIEWTDDPSVLKNAAEAGHCQLSGNEKGSSLADVILLIRNRSDNSIVSALKMKYTALHEIGHTLGIAGHSMNVRDVMFLGILNDSFPDGISERDTNTLKKIYSTSTTKLFSSDQNAWIANTNQGSAEVNAGHPLAAIPLLEQAVEQAPAEKKNFVRGVLGLAHYNHALNLIRARDMDSAKTSLDKAVELLEIGGDKKNLSKARGAYKFLNAPPQRPAGPPSFQFSR